MTEFETAEAEFPVLFFKLVVAVVADFFPLMAT